VARGGQRLELQARVEGPAHAAAPAAAAASAAVLVAYEDDHLAVVIKPPGMPTQVRDSRIACSTSWSVATVSERVRALRFLPGHGADGSMGAVVR
jgi:23S rRNA-/tRNA-specific pseudouridylate synthase